jgi:hypothetical protein
MHNNAPDFFAFEMDETGGQPSPGEQVVDVGNRDSVLDFTKYYLEAFSREKSVDEVHHVTAAISRYKGPRLVRFATLESFLEGLER